MTPEQRDAYNAQMRKYRAEHREEVNSYKRKRRAEHKDEHRYRMREYISNEVNSYGVTKHRVRLHSRKILYSTHDKIPGYEIHHCFSYDEENKFIYIPRDLHIKIHQLLRDNKISSDSNHWNAIRDLVNSCEEYTYIRS